MPSASIAVVVPAYCEERLIQRTISNLPDSVGQIVVVDDASTDETVARAREVRDSRIEIHRHEQNLGVGAAIYTGYRAALSGDCEAFVVLAGDNQMDHADLEEVAAPILSGAADYVKGNRTLHARFRDMPWHRRMGTTTLARITSLACGLRLGDSQCGYTAISRRAAASLDFDDLWAGYGYPNDLLITLTARGMRVEERPVRPVYESETSGLRPWHFFTILGVIARRAYREKRSQRMMPRLTQSSS